MKATHCYVGVACCGCIHSVHVDEGDKHTARFVADELRDGLTIERMTIEAFKASDRFQIPADCPHDPPSQFKAATPGAG